jgi:large subunit ribosomal protein L27
VKVFGGEAISAGGIIVRQVGQSVAPGKNVGLGKDFSIYSKIDGVVKFEWASRTKKQVSVYPAGE